MAALIKTETGIEAELVVGGRGEFAVSVDEETVARKGAGGFPADRKIVEAVRRALGSSPAR